jgi:hypothetical protein
MSRALTVASVLSCVTVLSGDLSSAAAGLAFHVTFDSSVIGAPVEFVPAFDNAIDFLEASYSDPITINLRVGWGEVAGRSLTPGDIGQSISNGLGLYSYAQVKNLLTRDKKSNDDTTAITNLPTVDPYGGTKFNMSNAQAKALGLLAGSATGTDGYVGFNSTTAYTFDPANRAFGGKIDFIGVALHEITEVMGRYGLTQNGAASGRYSPIDMFRYLSPGTLDITPASHTYFSIDGGQTNVNTFNDINSGDLSDWQGLTADAFNAFITSGIELPFTSGDITVMDVIGYDLAAPEPSSFMLTLSGIALLLCQHHRRVSLPARCSHNEALSRCALFFNACCFASDAWLERVRAGARWWAFGRQRLPDR